MRNRPMLRCTLLVCILLPLSFTNTLNASRTPAYIRITAHIPASVVQDTDAQITPLAQYGGTYNASVIEGGYIYFTEGSALNILDARDPIRVFAVARMALPFFPVELQVAHDIVYVRGVSDELLIVDASDHAAPIIQSRYPATGSTSRMQVQGTILYVAGPEGFRIVDTSNPTSPVVVGTYGYTPPAYDPYAHFVVDGTVVYLQASDGLYVLDISDPAEPRRTAVHSLGYDTSVRTARNNVLYTTTGEPCNRYDTCYTTNIYDVTNPNVLILRKTYDGYPEIAFTDSLALVRVPTGIKVLDVSDPTNIVERSSYASDTYLNGMHVVGKTAYFQQNGRFQVLDISDPSQPRTRGSFEMSQFAWTSSDVEDNVAILRDTDALEIVDLRDNDAPQGTTALQSGGTAQRLSVVDDRTYWSNEDTGTHVLDIGDVRRIRELGAYSEVGYINV